MAAPIGTSTSASAAQTTRVSAGADARPQVQSRRVSLKLGPLGITYSSDQVLWTEAAAAAGISASATSGEAENPEEIGTKPPVTPATALIPFGHDAAAGQQAEASEQARQSHDAQAAGRSFSLELAQAWRKQVEEKVRAEQIYDRTGTIRPDGSGAAQEADTSAAAHSADATDASCAAATTASTPAATNGAQQTRPPASRMRQAIGAYLACARNFSAVAPMLTAVA